MAVSLNSVVFFNSSLAKYQHVPRIGIGASSPGIGASSPKATHFTSPSRVVGLRRSIEDKKWGPCILFANGDNVAVETNDKGSGNSERSLSDDQSSAVNLPSLDSSEIDSQSVVSAKAELGSQIPKVPSNGSVVTSKQKQDVSSAGIKSTPIRSSRLTAREKLRAARVLSRKTEPKPSKTQLGSKVLEVLKESDRGKRRPGLPEAPTNLLDDSKRGMPKKGLTFELPGGADVFLIIFSVVFISTVMFTTTYIVWKVGAIHFNEY